MRTHLACSALLLVACAVDPSGLPGDEDGGGEVADARVDLSLPDGQVPDLGPIDMGPPDEGVDLAFVDSGPVDLGPDDLGPPDLGPPDLGPPDLGPDDLGPPDLGSPDLGSCGTAETCNAVDDDCDGAIDEDPGGPRGENICPSCTRAVSPGGVTYQICPSDVRWDEARDLCRASDYELASPETMAEDTFLDSVLIAGEDYWLALNDSDSEGNFEWEDRPADRPLGAFDDWDPATSEPNGSGDCVRIETDTLQWRDSDCWGLFQDTHYFACEAP